MNRKIVGKGSYGCVYKPSIPCKILPRHNFDYDKYVSKIMTTQNAETELSEYQAIDKMDPTDEYHLGQPILCKPNLNENNVKDITKCEHINLHKLKNHNDYSLLVLKFGGPDLNMFCRKYISKYLETDKTNRTDKFWLEVHNLIKGLKFFKDNGIIHYDIKPQNILFNTTNGKMKYIDFGLMRTTKEVIVASTNNKNRLGIFHWSYPFDCGFMNKTTFTNYKNNVDIIKTDIKNSLSKMIVNDFKHNIYSLSINNPESFKILFTYLNPDNTIPKVETQYTYINSFFNGFNKMIENKSYNDILNHTINSIDIFGLGFTLQFMANCFKRLNALSLEDFTKFSTFFHKMYDFNPLMRVINIEQLLNEYEGILLEMGILSRLEKSFKNNTLLNKPQISIVRYAPPSTKYLSAALQVLANEDPIEINVGCPEGKELNPITNRCIKKCKDGYERNDKFKCYSIATKTKKKPFRTKSIKICSSEQELNPITNRCIKKCKDGYERNDKFKCYSVTKKTKKNRKKS